MSLRGTAWLLCYELLAARIPRREWSFMNYGFAPLDPDAARPVLEAPDEPDRLCIQLYHHVATQVDLSGADVLEVGCGRGGGASYVARHLDPASTTGLDFSQRAVALCRRDRRGPDLHFVHGDAQSLPFADAAFDVVLNVESSHCYPSMDAFLAEARRVLRPGGHLLWADLRDRPGAERVLRQMAAAGFGLTEQRDITAEVLQALRQDNGRKLDLISAWVPRPVHRLFRQFAGVEGTRNFEGFRSGEMRYLSARLTAPPLPAGAR